MSADLIFAPETGLTGERWHKRVDDLELRLCEHPNVIDLPVEHLILPGIYRRTLRAPAGTLATTFIHKQQHPFVVTKGVVRVGTDEGHLLEVSAPFHGVTEAGTRRVCYVVEDAEWTTFHPIPEGMTSLEAIEEYLFTFRTLPDGTNVRDRFKAALAAKELAAGAAREIEP